MNYSEMKVLLEYYVDDVVDTAVAVRLLNEGKNRMAVAVNARFPDITASGLETFIFDERYHEGPVLYAAAMVKSYDSSLSEKESYMAQFRDVLRDFAKDYVPPIQYTISSDLQHFKVDVPEGEYVFNITEQSYGIYSDVEVFVDGIPKGFSKYGRTITLNELVPEGSIVTVRWSPDIFHAPRYMREW